MSTLERLEEMLAEEHDPIGILYLMNYLLQQRGDALDEYLDAFL